MGNEVRAYDLERTICDFIKAQDKMDPESFAKCLREHARRKDKKFIRLTEYSQKMGIEKKVNDYMEVLADVD